MVDLQEPTCVRVYSVLTEEDTDTEDPSSEVFLYAAPIVDDHLEEPRTLMVRREECPEIRETLLNNLREVVSSEDPYLWVREVAKVGDTPICLVAGYNMWEEAVKIQKSEVEKKVRASGLLSFFGGIFLGGAAGFFLGRR